MNEEKYREYHRNNSIVFKKTREAYGGLSNMASGYTINLNDFTILSSEALYQSLKYTSYPDIQMEILQQKSPMTAKMISKKYKPFIRKDWMDIRVKVMRWTLRLKLLNNWGKFGCLLLSTANHDIVEESKKDDFWGALPLIETRLKGENVLGRLLMQLRGEFLKVNCNMNYVLHPLSIPDFKFLGNPIEKQAIDVNDQYISYIIEVEKNVHRGKIKNENEYIQQTIFSQKTD